MPTQKDYTATAPKRENGQGRHEGMPHRPEEFLRGQPEQNPPEQGKSWPSRPGGAKPDTAMCENRDRPGFVDKDEDC